MPADQPQFERTISDDFFKGDVRGGIERVRKRLLDLTNRNRLLNFQYPARSKSVLRVVDELPNQLCKTLLDEGELVFDPVPKPPKSELQAWRNERLEKLRAEHGDEFDEAVDVRAESMAEPSAEEYAHRIGIRTSFELPSANSKTKKEERHRDRLIQTLHFADDLERVLYNIRAKANLAIQETGTNMLYLALGFLEWYESSSSDVKHLAPLFLLPVTLSKGKLDREQSVYRYNISYSGEDMMANASLQQKLLTDFGIEIPDLDDEEMPESYWSRVAEVTKHQERWKVRRHATLCMLSFGKMLMYRDLDPDRWDGDGLEAHPRIRDFFLGRDRGDEVTAEDYRIDDLPSVPGLIADADSSQHSALVDVLDGKNLVIEGPPGTGKSQTITNLIAASLEAGKTVLFVAEKLAALEVVHKRLTDAGLGLFCLELHSHKTHKKEFLNELEQRLDMRGRFRDPRTIEQLMKQLDDHRDHLNQYARLIDCSVGCMSETMHQVLWAACLRARRIEGIEELVKELEEPGVLGLTAADTTSERERLTAFGDALKAVLCEYPDGAEHPWSWVQSDTLTFLDRPVVADRVRRVRDCCREVDTTYGNTPTELSRFVTAAQALEKRPDGVPCSILKRLRNRDNRWVLSQLLVDLEHLHGVHARIASMSPAVALDPKASASQVGQCLEILTKLCDDEATLADLMRSKAKLIQSAEELRDCGLLNGRLRGAFPDAIDWTLESTHLAAALAEVLSLAPIDSLLLLSHVGTDTSRLPLVEQLHSQQQNLIGVEKTLQAKFELSVLHGPGQLRKDALTLSAAGWLGWLQSDVRAAKRKFRAVSRGNAARPKEEIAQELLSLADFLEKKQAFKKHPGLAAVAGESADGLQTPLSEMIVALKWLRQAELKLRAHGERGDRALARLKELDGVSIEVLNRQLEGSPDSQSVKERTASVATVIRRPLSDKEELSTLVQVVDELAVEVDLAFHTIETLKLPADWCITQLAELLRTLREWLAVEDAIQDDQAAADALGELWHAGDTDQGLVRKVQDYVSHVINSELNPGLIDGLLSSATDAVFDSVTAHSTALKDQLSALRGALQALVSQTATAPGPPLQEGVMTVEDLDVAVVADACDTALAAENAFDTWVQLRGARSALRFQSSGALAKLAIEKRLPVEMLVPTYEFVVYNSLAREGFREHPELVQFQGLNHDRLREAFAAADKEVISMYCQRVASAIDMGRPVPLGNGTGPVGTYTDLALIENEISKQQRHIPIRQLVRRAGRALQALKPCFMMGPLSVAHYLEPGGLTFDLVVMDEASQIKPEDALGAIARGGQLVVVGDSKQLPPTSFFDRVEEVDEEEVELAEGILDAESVLDIAASAYRPTRMLLWHYRSRHQSLIAFSNQTFYRNKLIVYPSSMVNSPHLGVHFHPVKGRYEGRRNLPEAAAVVEFVLAHMRQHPGESLGVATFNTTQRDVILEEFEQRIKNDRHSQAFLSNWDEGLEPFFVKNLESVQGDERDVIVISVTYGPDANGRVYQRFGPINGPTGDRRLNVLVSRAKSRVEVFSSMSADQIKLTEKSAPGVVVFKNYLAYADTGVLDQAHLTGREPDSDFEIEVAEALAGRGFETVAQVGVAGYFVDLAVRHPRLPGRFILGVECDGATYHSALSARDRDRLRQGVLEDKGWTIHRVWSTDWFRNPGRETDRIVELVQRLLEAEPVVDELPEYEFAVALPTQPAAVSEEENPVGPETDWITLEDAEVELSCLRDILVDTFSEISDNQNILRDEMLEAFLRYRPRSKEDWLSRIPLDLRLDTAPEHMSVLDDILSILGRISDHPKQHGSVVTDDFETAEGVSNAQPAGMGAAASEPECEKGVLEIDSTAAPPDADPSRNPEEARKYVESVSLAEWDVLARWLSKQDGFHGSEKAAIDKLCRLRVRNWMLTYAQYCTATRIHRKAIASGFKM